MARAQILIVEDEPGIADTLSYALRTEGFEPVWCATGDERAAARKLRELLYAVEMERALGKGRILQL